MKHFLIYMLRWAIFEAIFCGCAIYNMADVPFIGYALVFAVSSIPATMFATMITLYYDSK